MGVGVEGRGWGTESTITMEIQPNEIRKYIIYLERTEADGGVRRLFSGKKGRTSVP